MIPSIVARQIQATVLDYLSTTFSLSDANLETALFGFLRSERGLFRGPFVDLRLPFRKAPAGGAMPLDFTPDFPPYAHQIESWSRLSTRDSKAEPTLVTTGTGSGKTECFLYPILDHCLRHAGEKGIKAILLYPMNALASDQARRLAQLLHDDKRIAGKVRAGLYVGGEGQHGAPDRDHLVDDRNVLRQSPPDILLTNYRMLDFLLLRPEDQRLWQHNGPTTLQYLVLDELHTYDGAQGSDVACLIRRLRARLQIPDGVLCPVGTSATLGGDTETEKLSHLVGFATQVFHQAFDPSCVIQESRCSMIEALGPEVAEDAHQPTADDARQLDPEQHENVASWIRAQAKLWLGEVPEDRDGLPDPIACGERLRSHPFLRQLLRLTRGRPTDWRKIDRGLCEREDDEIWGAYPEVVRDAMLDSFLGLVSWARIQEPTGSDTSRRAHFLTVQLQLWMRELRHLLSDVQASWSVAGFAWASDQPGSRSPGWLPLAWCRECGCAGWASFVREAESHLQQDHRQVGRAWLERSRHCRFVLPGDGPKEDGFLPERIHPGSLALEMGEAEGESFAVRVGATVSEQSPPRFLQRCPECHTNQSLVMLGSRAPSLLSVAVNHLFQSEFNDDPKVLAFTDSVQDASHRAGFFGSRTWRFNLRSALQQILEQEGAMSLPQLAARVVPWLEAKLTHTTNPRLAAIAQLLPPDLRELDEYERYVHSEGRNKERELLEKLLPRLELEVSLEFGFSTRIGRSLERTGCSTAAPDDSRLARAAERLCLELHEEGVLGSSTADSPTRDPRRVRHFLRCLIERMRGIGAIAHAFLEKYREHDGAQFLLCKAKNALLPPLPQGPGTRSIRFLCDAMPSDRLVFETHRTGKGMSWYRDWASRCFERSPKDAALDEVYERAIRVLAAEGLFDIRATKGSGTSYALRAEFMHASPRVARLGCPTCRRELLLAEGEESYAAKAPCPAFRCAGHLELLPERRETYYSRRYREGRIQRIFAHEHTGLLDRHDRERLEDAFKSGSRPDAPNLFVCTPTLEMGIDIGDLSAAVLCSMPPTVASFLQRVGRAGRKTGNAVVIAMILDRPHDLYFEAQPDAMLSGQVQPPGCFLDAPEMLRRQLVAHAMDAWARETKSLDPIPPRVGLSLGEQAFAKFPGRFLEFHKQHEPELTRQFVALFDDSISDHNRPRLEAAGAHDEVRRAIGGAFDAVNQELRDLRALSERIRARKQKIENDPELPAKDKEEELHQIDDSLRLVKRLRAEIGGKYPLNVLTDAGVLPNYAFPEPGVSLDAVFGGKDSDGKREYRSRQYQRPASSAIRELAPWNTFYAEGHAIRVRELDVGSTAQPLFDEWRLCASCHHAVRATPGAEIATKCPRCDDERWADAGQLRKLLRFSRVRSLESRLQASVADDNDDRNEEFYRVEDLIDVGEENCSGARVVTDLPFGYELLQNVPLREINFGNRAEPVPHGNAAITVADRAIDVDGFVVCIGCGRVKQPDRSKREIEHAPWCPGRDDAKYAERYQEKLFLFREVRSEALRLLLPVAEVDREARQHSIKAALHFAFRRRFQGDPQHLEIRFHDEPAGPEGRRRFLVVFDRVPGGTGYLAELHHGNNLREILADALQALEDCSCQRRDPIAQACYQCLYAYQHQRFLTHVSNRTAREMIKEILSHWSKLASVPTLSDVSIAFRLESELEQLFVDALREWVEARKDPHVTLTDDIRRGRRFYKLRIGQQRWDVLLQEDIGEAQGVGSHSRPDFVLRPVGAAGGIRPVAVFCDGLTYHALPDEGRSRLGDDISKRSALLASRGYWVWSLTWKDLKDFSAGRKEHPEPMLAKVDGRKQRSLWNRMKLALPQEIARESSMNLLLRYLGNPNEDAWRQAVGASTAAWIITGPVLTPEASDSLELRLQNEAIPFDTTALPTAEVGAPKMARYETSRWGGLLAVVMRDHLSELRVGSIRCTLRLFDHQEARKDVDFESSWRRFLHAWNFLQFLDATLAIDSESVEQYEPTAKPIPFAIAADAPLTPTATRTQSEWTKIADAVLDDEIRKIVLELAARSAPLPAPPGEEVMSDGTVLADPELSWPDQEIALLRADQVEDKPTLERHGWTVFVSGHPDELIAALTANADEPRGGS